jgi:putative (di)nucleoside polyphosphate hydrolase
MANRPTSEAHAPDLPYRPCVGIMLLNRAGHAWIGRRRGNGIDLEHAWQMPQGGIDAGESPREAAFRELYEETNVGPDSVELLAEAPDWYAYDLPSYVAGRAWRGRYRGQTQRWFAFRFLGRDAEIDIHHPGGGHHRPEFDAWRWEPVANLPGLVVPFKRPVYDQVMRAFADLR